MDTTLSHSVSRARLAGAAASAALLLALVGPSVALAANTGKTTICHDTASATNPWVGITVSGNATQTGHNGDPILVGPTSHGASPFSSPSTCGQASGGSGGTSNGGSGGTSNGSSTVGTGGPGGTPAPTNDPGTTAPPLSGDTAHPGDLTGAVLGITSSRVVTSATGAVRGTWSTVPLPPTDTVPGSADARTLGLGMALFAGIGTFLLLLFGPLLRGRSGARR